MILALRYIFMSCPGRIIVLLMLLGTQGVLPAVNVMFTGKIINSIQMNDFEQVEFIFTIGLWCLTLLGVQCIQPLVNLVQGDVNEITTRYFNENIMRRMNQTLTLTPFEEKEKHEQLELLRREASYRPLNFIITFVFLLRSFIVICGLAFVLLKYSGIGLVVCSISVVPLLWINIKVEQKNWKNLLVNTKESVVMRYVFDACMQKNHLQEIRIYKLGEYLTQKYVDAAENMHKSMHKQRVYALLMPIPMVVLSLILLLIGMYLFFISLRESNLQVSAIAVALQSVIMLKTYLDDMASNGGHIFSLTGFFKAYHQFMHEFLEPAKNGNTRLEKTGSHEVKIKNLTYTYPNQIKPTINNLSLKIEKGQKIAILGDNGSGKTTLLKLILRLYESEKGSIRISGVYLEDLDIDIYRDTVSTVFQEYGRYEFTVKENIAFEHSNDFKYDNDIKYLLSEVELDLEPSRQLGQRFGGSEISVGQWQKLAIARALFRKADLFIFDEFSSSLDPEIEYKLFNKILSLDSTVVAVTHRLGKIKHFDKIIVMSEGKIIEEGDFDYLIKRKGKFYEMWMSQFPSVGSNDDVE